MKSRRCRGLVPNLIGIANALIALELGFKRMVLTSASVGQRWNAMLDVHD
jgi:hypothetical protein